MATQRIKSKIPVFEASIANTLACFLGVFLDIVSKQVSQHTIRHNENAKRKRPQKFFPLQLG